eukprot:2202093-Amphidinium_carterae.2
MAVRTPPKYVVGAHVEYYSKSYDEWIPATVNAIRPDGGLRLLHDDGSVLKVVSCSHSSVGARDMRASRGASGPFSVQLSRLAQAANSGKSVIGRSPSLPAAAPRNNAPQPPPGRAASPSPKPAGQPCSKCGAFLAFTS